MKRVMKAQFNRKKNQQNETKSGTIVPLPSQQQPNVASLGRKKFGDMANSVIGEVNENEE